MALHPDPDLVRFVVRAVEQVLQEANRTKTLSLSLTSQTTDDCTIDPSLPRLAQCHVNAAEVLQVAMNPEQVISISSEVDLAQSNRTGEQLLFIGDLIIGLLDALTHFGKRERYREAHDRGLRYALEAVQAVFCLKIGAPPSSNVVAQQEHDISPNGAPAATTSKPSKRPSIGSCALQFFLKPEEFLAIAGAGPELVGVQVDEATSLAEYFLLQMGSKFDDLLRIFVFGHARELEKCRKLEREQLFDDEGEQWMVSASIKRMAEKKRLAQLLWRCFSNLVSLAQVAQQAVELQGEGNIENGEENTTSSTSFPSVEIFLELCNNDVELAVKLAVLLLDVEPLIAVPLCQMWDSSQAHKAVRETMRQVKEMVTGVFQEQPHVDGVLDVGGVNAATQELSVLDVFEYRKRLAFCFIDNDVLTLLLRRCEKLLLGGGSGGQNHGAVVIGAASSSAAATAATSTAAAPTADGGGNYMNANENNLSPSTVRAGDANANFLQQLDQEGQTRVVLGLSNSPGTASAHDPYQARHNEQLQLARLEEMVSQLSISPTAGGGSSGTTSSGGKRNMIEQSLLNEQSISDSQLHVGERTLSGNFNNSDDVVAMQNYNSYTDPNYPLDPQQQITKSRMQLTSRATLLVIALTRIVSEMATVCFDDKHYSSNDVDLISRKVANVVMRLVRHLALRRQEIERFVRKCVLPPTDALLFFENHPVPDMVDEAAVAVGGVLYSSRARPLCLEWREYLTAIGDTAGTLQASLCQAVLDMLLQLKCLSQFSFDENLPWAVPRDYMLYGAVAAKVFLVNLPDEPDFNLPTRCNCFEQAATFAAQELQAPREELSEAHLQELPFHLQRFWRAIRTYFVWCDGESVHDPFWQDVRLSNEAFRDENAEFGKFFPIEIGSSGLIVQKSSILLLQQMFYYSEIQEGYYRREKMKMKEMTAANYKQDQELQMGNAAEQEDQQSLLLNGPLPRIYTINEDPLAPLPQEIQIEPDVPLTPTPSQLADARWERFDEERSFSGGENINDPNKARSIDMFGGMDPMGQHNQGSVNGITFINGIPQPTRIPEEYRCGIDGTLMQTPVRFMCSGGYFVNYELLNLQQWSAIKGDVCPVTGETFTADSLQIDESLKSEIAEFRNRTGWH
ncbi:unnamed protein product [Amoebophrya sp. A120]|nr:unnamed protein product [Amoebophrya sp. A120]|eukprot:GSA120T00008131001.1